MPEQARIGNYFGETVSEQFSEPRKECRTCACKWFIGEGWDEAHPPEAEVAGRSHVNQLPVRCRGRFGSNATRVNDKKVSRA